MRCGTALISGCGIAAATMQGTGVAGENPAGIVPGGGALERLPLLVGRSRAIEIVLGADDFDADMAERYGWINRAIPDTVADL
jgi:enoyl-CoA hydratase/carnithine racemase